MAKYAIEQITTKYWVIQEDEPYNTNPKNNKRTVMVIAYATPEDAKENHHGKKIDQSTLTLTAHGNTGIKEQHYIQEASNHLGGTKINL